MEILVERFSPEDAKLISESVVTGVGKNLFLNGIFMQAEIRNRNGRIYPLAEISRVVEECQPMITQNGLVGELDHPNNLNLSGKEISHVITEMKMHGNNAVGKLKILPTPNGEIAKVLIENKIPVGVSSRGAGDVDGQGMVSGFQFIAIDLVINPSAPDAYPKAVFESLERYRNGNVIRSLAEEVREDPKAQEFLKKEILKFIRSCL